MMYAIFKTPSGARQVRPTSPKGRPQPVMPGDGDLRIVGPVFRSQARAKVELKRLQTSDLKGARNEEK